MESLARLKCEARLLHVLGISKPLIARMAKRAAANGTSVEAELLASGVIEEEAYFAGLGADVRLAVPAGDRPFAACGPCP